MTEIIGYLGSIGVAVSLLMRNVYFLRIINLIGAVFFVIYGFLIKAPAVWSVNLFISFVDIYYIYDLRFKTHIFDFIKSNYNGIVESFIKFYFNDIVKYFGDLDKNQLKDLNYYLILRNFSVVGIFAYKHIDDENILICIDYIIKEWRDFKNAQYFWNYIKSTNEFRNKKLHAFSSNKKHITYLKRIGFREVSPNEYIFEF